MLIIGCCFCVCLNRWYFLSKKYKSVWSDDYLDTLEDEQSKMIAFALRASSSHNTQPWLVKVTSETTLQLYADLNKSLPIVDGDNKQLLMSQGAFIESYKQIAMQYGYAVQIVYETLNDIEKTPLVATISITKHSDREIVDAVSSSTYSAISTNNIELNKILMEHTDQFQGLLYTIIDSEDEVLKLQKYLLEGTKIESQDEAATKELLNVFRFTEWEKNQNRFGLSLNNMPAAIKPFIQPILKLTSKNWESFGNSSIDIFEKRLAEETSYILIKCKNPRG